MADLGGFVCYDFAGGGFARDPVPNVDLLHREEGLGVHRHLKSSFQMFVDETDLFVVHGPSTLEGRLTINIPLRTSEV